MFLMGILAVAILALPAIVLLLALGMSVWAIYRGLRGDRRASQIPTNDTGPAPADVRREGVAVRR